MIYRSLSTGQFIIVLGAILLFTFAIGVCISAQVKAVSSPVEFKTPTNTIMLINDKVPCKVVYNISHDTLNIFLEPK